MPATWMVPRSGTLSPTNILVRTVLPEPLRPMKATVSPVNTSRSTPSSTTFLAESLGDASEGYQRGAGILGLQQPPLLMTWGRGVR